MALYLMAVFLLKPIKKKNQKNSGRGGLLKNFMKTPQNYMVIKNRTSKTLSELSRR